MSGVAAAGLMGQRRISNPASPRREEAALRRCCCGIACGIGRKETRSAARRRGGVPPYKGDTAPPHSVAAAGSLASPPLGAQQTATLCTVRPMGLSRVAHRWRNVTPTRVRGARESHTRKAFEHLKGRVVCTTRRTVPPGVGNRHLKRATAQSRASVGNRQVRTPRGRLSANRHFSARCGFLRGSHACSLPAASGCDTSSVRLTCCKHTRAGLAPSTSATGSAIDAAARGSAAC
jgi:hypothetical protein